MSLRFPVTTRFAPTPSGELHLGHVLAAWEARRLADVHGGRCLLRIEDLDAARSRDPFVLQRMLNDLEWIGLHFDGEMVRQSERTAAYSCALDKLRAVGLLYPCFCSRAEIRAEWEGISRAPHGTPYRRYSGHCRSLPGDLVEEKLARGVPHAWRIDMRRVQDIIGCPTWEDIGCRGVQRCVPSACEDVVLARKDAPASYHLAVVVDDAWQGVNLVSRGEDLLGSTPIHRALQGVLALPVPLYAHHILLRDATGRRLAKRDQSCSIRILRDQGFSRQQVMAAVHSAIKEGGRCRLPLH